MSWLLILLLFLSLDKPVGAEYRVGVDYHATSDVFSKSAFLTQYQIPSVRSEVKRQLQEMANAGVKVISTRMWMTDPDNGRFPELRERHGFPPNAQEIVNLKQYVEDVAIIRTLDGGYLDLYLIPMGNGCAGLEGQFCNYTWEQTVFYYKKSYTDILNAVGGVVRPDGKKAVSMVYMLGEVMVGPMKNIDRFMIDVYPFFVNLVKSKGMTPSVYFIVDVRDVAAGDRLVWIRGAIDFMKNNNLPIPDRLDLSFYASSPAMVTQVIGDLMKMYPGKRFGIAETYYPQDKVKRTQLGQAFIESNRSIGQPEEWLFWTTPNSGENGEGVGFPFDVAAYLAVKNTDFNNDKKTNLVDFAIWKANYLAGKMTFAEFAAWKKAYLGN